MSFKSILQKSIMVLGSIMVLSILYVLTARANPLIGLAIGLVMGVLVCYAVMKYNVAVELRRINTDIELKMKEQEKDPAKAYKFIVPPEKTEEKEEEKEISGEKSKSDSREGVSESDVLSSEKPLGSIEDLNLAKSTDELIDDLNVETLKKKPKKKKAPKVKYKEVKTKDKEDDD